MPTTNRSESPAAYIAELDKAHVFPGPIVTQLEPLRGFYPAEDYHQDFAVLHPSYPYIVFNDLPKVDNLKRLFADGLSRDAGHRDGLEQAGRIVPSPLAYREAARDARLRWPRLLRL